MLFLTAPAPPKVKASELFRHYGNTTDVPVQVSELPIAGVPVTRTHQEVLAITYLWACVGAHLRKREIDLADVQALNVAGSKFPTMLPSNPIVAVTFPGRDKSEAVDQMATSLGLSRLSYLGTQLFQGVVDEDEIHDLIAQGPVADVHVPIGSTNLNGLVGFLTLERIASCIGRLLAQKEPLGTRIEMRGNNKFFAINTELPSRLTKKVSRYDSKSSILLRLLGAKASSLDQELEEGEEVEDMEMD